MGVKFFSKSLILTLVGLALGNVLAGNEISCRDNECVFLPSGTVVDGSVFQASATWHGPLEIAGDCTIRNATIRNDYLTEDVLISITRGNVVFENVTFDCSKCSPQAIIRMEFGSTANITFKGNCRFLTSNKNVDAIYIDYQTKGKVEFDSSFTGAVGGPVAVAYDPAHPQDDPAVNVIVAGSGTFENYVALDGNAADFHRSSISISGGSFAVEPHDACLADKYAKALQSDGHWGIVAGKANLRFATLSDYGVQERSIYSLTTDNPVGGHVFDEGDALYFMTLIENVGRDDISQDAPVALKVYDYRGMLCLSGDLSISAARLSAGGRSGLNLRTDDVQEGIYKSVCSIDPKAILDEADRSDNEIVNTYVVRPAQPIALGEALDNDQLTFTSGGDIAWFGQHTMSVSGGDAAMAGPLNAGETSWLETRVTGPGRLTFAIAACGNDAAEISPVFTVDGKEQSLVAGDGSSPWARQSVDIGSGEHVLHWTFARTSNLAADAYGSCWAVLDEVVWRTGSWVDVRVSLDANGGQVGVDHVGCVLGEVYGELPVPSWAGHAFLGWFTQREGGQPVIGETIVALGEAHTLYAHWRVVSPKADLHFLPLLECGTAECSMFTLNSEDVSGTHVFDAGDDLYFHAAVGNSGSVGLSASLPVSYEAYYDGQYLASSGMIALPTARLGPDGESWFTLHSEDVYEGIYKVVCTIDPENSVDEEDREDNQIVNAYVVRPAQPIALGEAVDNAQLTFTSGGDLAWFGQRVMSVSGGDAAMAGPLNAGETSWLETRVTGPGRLTFALAACGYGTETISPVLTVDGSACNLVVADGSTPWTRQSVEISSGGTHVLRWTFSRASTQTADAYGSCWALLDEVAWRSGTFTPVTVTLDANGGTSAADHIDCTSDEPYGSLPEPQWAGRTFLGWYTQCTEGSLVTADTVVTKVSAHTLYAHWRANSYRIVFHACGGSGRMEDQVMVCGTSAALSANAFVKAGSDFSGWARTDGGEVAFQDGKSVLDLSLDDGGIVDLYAVWSSAPIVPDADFTIENGVLKKYKGRGGDVTIPSGVTSIGIRAFQSSSGVTSVIIPSGVTTIGDYAFSVCPNLTSVRIPSSVRSIGECAFWQSGLTSVEVPQGVTSIGESAFRECPELVSVTIPSGVTSIGASCFYACFKLSSVTLPSSLKSIGEYALSWCPRLTSIEIPSGVTSIGAHAFAGSGLTFVTIPSSVTSIGTDAFDSCGSLKTVYVDAGDAQRVRSLFAGSGFAVDGISFVEPTCRVTYAPGDLGSGSTVFDVKSRGVALTLRDALFSRMGYTQTGWSRNSDGSTKDYDLGVVYEEDAAVTLYPYWRRILQQVVYRFDGNGADVGEMFDVSYSSSDDMPLSPFMRQGYTFLGWASEPYADVAQWADGEWPDASLLPVGESDVLTVYAVWRKETAFVSDPTPRTASANGYTWKYRIVNGGAELFSETAYKTDVTPTPTGAVTIPQTLGGYAVTGIGQYALAQCDGMTSIVIPSTVVEVGMAAFYGCRRLQSIELPATVRHLGMMAFSGCASLSGFRVPRGVMYIENENGSTKGVFSGCSGISQFEVSVDNRYYQAVDGILYDKTLRTVIACPGQKEQVSLPPSLANVYGCAFDGCSQLRELVLPDGVANIGRYAFAGTQIDELVVPGSMKYIRSEALQGGFRKIVLAEGVEDLDGAFAQCPNLEEVFLPESMKRIGDCAFTECNMLKRVCIPSGVTNVSDAAFSDCTSLRQVVFAGDCPEVIGNLFNREYPWDSVASEQLVTYVVRGSRGWNGGASGLPGSWPMADGYESRAIRYWDGVLCTVHFHANGGKGAMADQVLSRPAKLQANAFTCVGHSLIGWATSAGGDAVYADGEFISLLSNEVGGTVDLYAVWDFSPDELPEIYHYDGNGATSGSMPDYVFDGEGSPLNEFRRTGYVFLGWSLDPEASEPMWRDGDMLDAWMYEPFTNEHTLYAIWGLDEEPIPPGPVTTYFHFNANGGKGVMADQAFVCDVAQCLTSNSFVRVGYKFLGWSTSAHGEIVYKDGQLVSNLTATADGVVNLYAVWDCVATTWTEDNDFSAAVANTYDGYAIDADFNLVGIVQVKTTKQSVKKDVVTITAAATVTGLDGKKWSYSSGSVTDDGSVTGLKCTAKGCPVPEFGVTLGKNGMESEWGEYVIFGARNGMGTKGDAMMAALEAYKGKWSVTLSCASLTSGQETASPLVVRLQLDVQSKGVVKIAGNWESGAKVSASAQMVMGDGFAYVPVMVKATKTSSVLNALLRIDAEGEVALLGEGSAGETPPPQVEMTLVDGGRTTAAIEVVGYLAKNPVKAGAAYVGRVAVNELAYPAKFTQKGLPTGLKIDAATGVVSGAPTKPGEYEVTFTVTSSMNSKSKDTVDVTIKVDNYVDGLIPVEDYYGPYTPGVSYTVTIPEAAGCTVSGLPAGMKWTAKEIKAKDGSVTTPANSVYGIPTKPGKYTVYFKKSVSELNEKGKPVKVTHTATATFEVADYPEITLKPSLAIAGSDPVPVADGAALSFFVGVRQSFAVDLAGTLDGVDTTIAAKGLPTGLKLIKKTVYVDPAAKKKVVDHYEYVIEGVPTKASSLDKQKNVVPSHIVLTASNKYKWSGTFAFDITVEALPSWAFGTFDGGNTNGMAQLTVSNVGKISGKWMSEGLTWTLSAASFDAYISSEQMYVATVIGKSGKLAMTNEIEVTENGIVGFLTSGQETASPFWEAWRNGWKEESRATLAKQLKGKKKLVGDVALTVGANGTVTAKGLFVTGFDGKKQKDITYSASCSTVLIPTAEAGQYRVYLYFPPKSGKFDGFSACERVMFVP